MRSALLTTTPFPTATPTATIPPGDTLKTTQSEMESAQSQVSFQPIPPRYLPNGARLGHVQAIELASGVYGLDVTWTMSAGPLRALHLREQPASAPTNYASAPAAQAPDMTWRLGQHPTWSAMSQVEGPGWSGVEQSRGQVALLLAAQPAPGASPTDVASELRLTSLSLDANYSLPSVPIVQPPSNSLLRSIASVAGSGGQMWTWDVTLSADNLSRNATITSMNGASAKESVTEITTYAGAGVRLDNINKLYQTVPGPTPYKSPPSGVTEIAYHASDFLNTGQLWNLGAPVTIHLPDKRAVTVYDLYRVDSVLPEHVYVNASTGAVVAIFVDTGSSISPGGPGGAHSYASISVCTPYTVTYSWIIFEPASQPASLFSRNPPHDYKRGAVSLPFTCGG
jgi:hypothetical protein